MNVKGTKDLHDVEVKVRLTEGQAQTLRQLAAAFDIPPAVIARSLIDKGMEAALQSYFNRPQATPKGVAA